jgi:hypothetical protein
MHSRRMRRHSGKIGAQCPAYRILPANSLWCLNRSRLCHGCYYRDFNEGVGMSHVPVMDWH